MILPLHFFLRYFFIAVNKNLDLRSNQFKLIRMLNSDPDYQSYVLLVKIYMSLCNINKSVEVDYYKVKCDGEFRIIIPRNFSKITSAYLEEMSIRYTFSESEGIMKYDDLPIFDLRPHQPEIDLYRVRFDPATDVQVSVIVLIALQLLWASFSFLSLPSFFVNVLPPVLTTCLIPFLLDILHSQW